VAFSVSLDQRFLIEYQTHNPGLEGKFSAQSKTYQNIKTNKEKKETVILVIVNKRGL
jgi:hypothetical protein